MDSNVLQDAVIELVRDKPDESGMNLLKAYVEADIQMRKNKHEYVLIQSMIQTTAPWIEKLLASDVGKKLAPQLLTAYIESTKASSIDASFAKFLESENLKTVLQNSTQQIPVEQTLETKKQETLVKTEEKKHDIPVEKVEPRCYAIIAKRYRGKTTRAMELARLFPEVHVITQDECHQEKWKSFQEKTQTVIKVMKTYLLFETQKKNNTLVVFESDLAVSKQFYDQYRSSIMTLYLQKNIAMCFLFQKATQVPSWLQDSVQWLNRVELDVGQRHIDKNPVQVTTTEASLSSSDLAVDTVYEKGDKNEQFIDSQTGNQILRIHVSPKQTMRKIRFIYRPTDFSPNVVKVELMSLTGEPRICYVSPIVHHDKHHGVLQATISIDRAAGYLPFILPFCIDMKPAEVWVDVVFTEKGS